ncbi:elongation factor G [Buchnera aphidicola (Schlechtendalia chinensis)]|uniref:Ion-translocating oxidoreductase complex subunit E n=1 Tax=Buchnera aphidicola subsp. Schlechtendalia chinensis TaxID=118110 RepID=A0A172WD89_BUCSC|nr:electron transport complex subunit E [Buchnera aphidicola]ANF16924.1 elongation factor G [Buchnera aphidicola (Schlechtendalia chinensis)]
MNNVIKTFCCGVWTQNSSLVQLLGLCPILAITTNITSALGLGIITTCVLVITNVIISIFKFWIPKNIRIPIYIMVISSVVSCFDMLIHAYSLSLYQSLGIFIPLIITNCVICGRADFVAINSSVLVSFLDGLFVGLGSTLAIFFIGLVRELFGSGTLFFGIENLFGSWSKILYVKIIKVDYVMLFFLYPAGAFMVLGFILAGKNFIDKKINFNNYNHCSKKSKLQFEKNEKFKS